MDAANQLGQTQVEFNTWVSKCLRTQNKHITQMDVKELTEELLRLCNRDKLSYKCFTILEDYCITKRIAVYRMITNVTGA